MPGLPVLYGRWGADLKPGTVVALHPTYVVVKAASGYTLRLPPSKLRKAA